MQESITTALSLFCNKQPLLFLYLNLLKLNVCVFECPYHGMPVEVRGQLGEEDIFFSHVVSIHAVCIYDRKIEVKPSRGQTEVGRKKRVKGNEGICSTYNIFLSISVFG